MLRPDDRDLDPEKVWLLSEDDAYGLFVDFRWADNGGKPYSRVVVAWNPIASAVDAQS